jgi:WD40 repeat protein
MNRVLLASLLIFVVIQNSLAETTSQIPLQGKQDLLSTITTIKLSPSGSMLAVGYADGSVAMWNTEDNKRLWTTHGDWRITARLGVSPGNPYEDQIIDLSNLPKN